MSIQGQTHMQAMFACFIFTLLLHGTYAEANTANWRYNILKDVIEFPRLGAPGNVVVYSSKAASILTGPAADSVITAAEYGSGRAVVFSQDAYVKEFNKAIPSSKLAKINQNIKKWVSASEMVYQSEVLDLNGITDFDEVPLGTKILLWWDTRDRTQAFKQDVANWINYGGGIIFGTTPWGYLSIYPEKTLQDLPYDYLMKIMGLSFSPGILSGRGSIFVRDNKAKDANLAVVISKSKSDVNHLVKYKAVVENALDSMPDSALVNVLSSITEMVKAHTGSYHSIPTKFNPVSTNEGKALTSVMNRIYIRAGKFDGNTIPPGADVFPGTFTREPSLSYEMITVRADGKPSTVHPTGMYLPPGKTLEVVLESPIFLAGWSVVVGAHRDKLYSSATKWRRWPDVQIKKNIRSATTRLTSPFGGLIYLKCPNGATQLVTVTLKNVVKAPYFDIRKSGSESNWKAVRNYPGLWADIYGDKMGITLPASAIRYLDSPSQVMKIWDAVNQMHIDLRGKHKGGGRREWIVSDEQPSAGYMHSGYPIVTGLDVATPRTPEKYLLDAANILKNGRWGVFHELGHNQQDNMWTFYGTREVTCNIFTQHAMERVTGIKPWEQTWLKSQRPRMQDYLKAGADFDRSWRNNPAVALGIYAQLARDMGWHVYKAVFREYDGLMDYEKPRNDAEKIDQWITRFSKNSRKNLCPMFEFWGFPIRASVFNSVRHLPAFLHSDETTRYMAPNRARMIRQKYGIRYVYDNWSEEDSEDEFTCTLSEEDFYH